MIFHQYLSLYSHYRKTDDFFVATTEKQHIMTDPVKE